MQGTLLKQCGTDCIEQCALEQTCACPQTPLVHVLNQGFANGHDYVTRYRLKHRVCEDLSALYKATCTAEAVQRRR